MRNIQVLAAAVLLLVGCDALRSTAPKVADAVADAIEAVGLGCAMGQALFPSSRVIESFCDHAQFRLASLEDGRFQAAQTALERLGEVLTAEDLAGAGRMALTTDSVGQTALSAAVLECARQGALCTERAGALRLGR